MKRTLFFGCLIGSITVLAAVMFPGCGDSPYWFGSAGPSGIDTIAPLPRLSMITTDDGLIPELLSPDSGTTGIALTTYDIGAAKPILRWRSVAGASGYRVVLSTSKRFGTLLLDDASLDRTDTSTAVSTSLSYETEYFWAVCAYTPRKDSGWSAIRTFTTRTDPLPQLQRNYVDQKFGMFIHFGMSTFARYLYPNPHGEWALGDESPDVFRPDSLDIGQWADVAHSAHCRYVVMTAKHHGGFCLWPSDAPWSITPHSVALSSWYTGNGQRDVCREFVDSVRSRGMEPGFYYSIRDETNPPTLAMVKGHVTELLSNYGDIKVIWFDGWGWSVGYRPVPYDTIADLVHRLNDSLGHHTIISENNHQFSLWNTEIVQYEIPIDGPPLEGNTLPSEGCEPLRGDNCWFWHPMNTTLKNTQFILDRITAANAVNATYLLDVTPDTLGLIPDDQVRAMRDIGTEGVQQGILTP